MKKVALLITIILQLFLNNIEAQIFDYKYENRILTATFNNGYNVPRTVKFILTKQDLDSIKQSKLFINSVFGSNNSNEQVLKFILLETNTAILQKQLSLPDYTSFDFIENSMGSIFYFNETIKIKFNYTIQNELGNTLIKSALLYIPKQ